MRTQGWIGSLLALGLFACGGPKSYVIQGEVTGFPDSTEIYLTNNNEDRFVDTAWVVGGHFQLEGPSSEEPMLVYLMAAVESQMKVMPLLIGNEQVSIHGDLAEFPSRMKVSGSKYHGQWEEFAQQTLLYQLQRDSLQTLYVTLLKTTQNGEEIKKIRDQFAVLDQKIDSAQTAYLFTHPDTYPSLMHLQYKMSGYSKDTVQMLFDQMSEELQTSSYAKPVRTYIESQYISIGDPFLDFEAEDQNGNRIRLSDLVGKDGKYVLLNFSATGCYYCRSAATEMREMVKTYSDSLSIVSVLMDRRPETRQEVLVEDSICWPSLWSDQERERRAISIPYQVRSFPTFFVIDPQGVIVQKWNGYRAGIFEEKIGRLKNDPSK